MAVGLKKKKHVMSSLDVNRYHILAISSLPPISPQLFFTNVFWSVRIFKNICDNDNESNTNNNIMMMMEKKKNS